MNQRNSEMNEKYELIFSPDNQIDNVLGEAMQTEKLFALYEVEGTVFSSTVVYETDGKVVIKDAVKAVLYCDEDKARAFSNVIKKTFQVDKVYVRSSKLIKENW